MPRKQFTNQERLRLVALSRQRQEKGESLKSICRDLGLQPKQIRDWRAKEDRIAAADSSNKSIAQGRTSSIIAIEEPLIEWYLDMRELGIPISIKTLVKKAESFLPDDFAKKSELAKYQTIRRLLNANEISMPLDLRTRVAKKLLEKERQKTKHNVSQTVEKS